jgi:hypothetical protein
LKGKKTDVEDAARAIWLVLDGMRKPEKLGQFRAYGGELMGALYQGIREYTEEVGRAIWGVYKQFNLLDTLGTKGYGQGHSWAWGVANGITAGLPAIQAAIAATAALFPSGGAADIRAPAYAAAGAGATYNITVYATGGAERGDTRRMAQDIWEEVVRRTGVR